MKRFKVYRTMGKVKSSRAITVKTDGDIVILRSDKGVCEIMEDNGKFYAIGHNGQPTRIDATEENIKEAMRYCGFFEDEPVKKSEDKPDSEGEGEIKIRPILRKK